MYGTYGPMMESWGQLWQWMGQVPMMTMMLMLPVLMVVVVVAFVLIARDAHTKRLTARPH
jgi:hypothetical protein